MAIDFDSNLPIYIQVMDYIKKEIVSGRLKPGDRVDSVRDLALHFGVNRIPYSDRYPSWNVRDY